MDASSSLDVFVCFKKKKKNKPLKHVYFFVFREAALQRVLHQ